MQKYGIKNMLAIPDYAVKKVEVKDKGITVWLEPYKRKKAKCGKCGSMLKTEELFTPQPIMISDGNFENMVLKSPLPVLMWAWAPW